LCVVGIFGFSCKGAISDAFAVQTNEESLPNAESHGAAPATMNTNWRILPWGSVCIVFSVECRPSLMLR
jgi:hypothetical protein